MSEKKVLVSKAFVEAVDGVLDTFSWGIMASVYHNKRARLALDKLEIARFGQEAFDAVKGRSKE